MGEVIFFAMLGAALGLAFHGIHKLDKNQKALLENQEVTVKRLDNLRDRFEYHEKYKHHG